MAREFQRGHKAKISDLTAGTDLYVGVRIAAPGLAFDISCFGLDADEQLSDDRYFIFFNQPKSPEESIQLLGAQAGDTESFRVTLDRIPANIHKLSFTATIDGAGQMSQIGPGYIRVVAGGEEVVRYAFDGTEFTTERAVMLGDFYLKDVWRFAAVGQGFDGGLDALLRNFGGEVAEEEPPAPAQGAAPGFAPPAETSAPPAFGVPAAPQAPQPAPAFGAPPAPPAPAPQHQPVHAAPTIVAPLAPRPRTHRPHLSPLRRRCRPKHPWRPRPQAPTDSRPSRRSSARSPVTSRGRAPRHPLRRSDSTRPPRSASSLPYRRAVRRRPVEASRPRSSPTRRRPPGSVGRRRTSSSCGPT
ncbi:Stress response protein SCP2 [Streptomyces sp. BpilaLS-43]|nr:Stress response protein SCP2 [Streptomyces sp. BpilaLS-43]